MTPPKFSVGQLVIVVAEGVAPASVATMPRKGQVYTISESDYESGRREFKEGWYYGLAEIDDTMVHEPLLAPIQETPAEAIAELIECLESITA